MTMVLRRHLNEVCTFYGVSSEIVLHYIEEEWIIPYDKENVDFDEEDMARLKLILELENDFGVNEEAIPIILKLIDQLHSYRKALK